MAKKTISQDLYYTAVTRIQELETELAALRKHGEERDKAISAQDKNVRKLCETILANVPKEMVLGKPYAWGNLSVGELILKASIAYPEIIKMQTGLMNRLLSQYNIAVQRCIVLESKINELLSESEHYRNNTENQSSKDKEEKKGETTNVPPVVINGEAEDIGDVVSEILGDSAKEAVQMAPKHTPHSAARTKNRKAAALAGKAKKEEEVRQFAYIELDSIMSKIDNVGWDILFCIGEQGLSQYTEIESAVIGMDKERTKNIVKNHCYALEKSGVLTVEKFSIPAYQIMVFNLTGDVGKRIFISHFRKEPVQSESQKLLSEHSSYAHGYAILKMSELLKNNGLYESVDIYQRNEQIDTGHGQGYIPDILIKDKNSVPVYIEYECGTTIQTEFNSKCSKIAGITDTVNIIGTNKETVDALKSQVDKWIKAKGIKSLKGIKVRLASYQNIAPKGADKASDVRLDKTWKYVYNLEDGSEPVQNY